MFRRLRCFTSLENHLRTGLIDIELGDVDGDTTINIQPITTTKLNHQFSTVETTGKLGKMGTQESSVNPNDVSNWNDNKSWPEVIKERNKRTYAKGNAKKAKKASILTPRKLNYPEFVMHAYGQDANECLKDEREEFMGSITKVRVIYKVVLSRLPTGKLLVTFR